MDYLYNDTQRPQQVDDTNQGGLVTQVVRLLHDTPTLYIVSSIIVGVIILGDFKIFRKIAWFLDGLLGGAPHTIDLPGPPGLPIVGNLLEVKHYSILFTLPQTSVKTISADRLQLSNGHVPKIAEWTKRYGDVIRVSLGEREAVFINSHTALAKTIVQQGPAYQSRPTFKLFHSDFASSGIWTVGTSPYSERLVRTRKALSSQIAPRLLPIYTPVIHPKLKKLLGEILALSEGPAIDMAEKLHRFGTGQVSEQLMGTPLDDDMVGMLAENETNICKSAHRTAWCQRLTCL